MTKLVALTALVSGLLLITVPRYILPACEYEGYSPMHCSDTARAEYIAGAVLIIISGAAFVFREKRMPQLISAVAACVVYGIAFWLPDKFGYCHSTRMPCNYGMVPGVRFIAVAGTLLMGGAIIGLWKTSGKKGTA